MYRFWLFIARIWFGKELLAELMAQPTKELAKRRLAEIDAEFWSKKGAH